MSAEIYDSFDSLINNLVEQAANNGDANRGLVQRKWRIPPEWDSSPTDIEGLGEPFDRSDINADYPTFFSGDGTAGDCASAKLQLDHVAHQERAFRLRHATSVRCCMHAASRRVGQSRDGGSFQRIYNHAQDLIVAGSA
jgi:hypothetical protein